MCCCLCSIYWYMYVVLLLCPHQYYYEYRLTCYDNGDTLRMYNLLYGRHNAIIVI